MDRPSVRSPAKAREVGDERHAKRPFRRPNKRKARQAAGLFVDDGVVVGYIRSIIACPNPEQDTCVAPGMRRAKS